MCKPADTARRHPPSGSSKPDARLPLRALSLADCFAAALVFAAFGQADSWRSLLADGDTGWHIRTGEWILRHRAIPAFDLFSFSRPGQPWFAWEWLSDVLFAAVHHVAGLAGIAALCAAVIAASAVLLYGRMVAGGAGILLAAGVTAAAVNASTIHYLARPHAFSLLGFAAALALLERDRRRAGRTVWLLAPLTALWANLHGGFAGWLATLGVLVLSHAAVGDRPGCRRYGLLALLCAAASLANPFGWTLHGHILRYLASPWIQDAVQEFQSPRFRSENSMVFAVLLVAAAAAAGRWRWRRDPFPPALALLWAFAALRSARHIPQFALAAAPLVAWEAERLWRERAAGAALRAPVRVLYELSAEWSQRAASVTLRGAAACAAILWLCVPAGGLPDFPKERFPVEALAVQRPAIAASRRLLTSDQWADYLIFHDYPERRVFMDGRSDFYGPDIGREYQTLQSGTGGWRAILDKYAFDAALLPHEWPLSSSLGKENGWREVYRDRSSVLFRKDAPGGRS